VTPFSVAVEITPPRQSNPEILLRRARLLGAAAGAVHVVQRPDRQSSLDASVELEQAGLRAVWHVTNRGRGRAEIEAEIERAAAAGLRAALVVRGEGEVDDRADTPSLRAIVARLRARLSGARIGATLSPYLPRERVLANLWPKLEAGAAFIQTQPVFELAALRGVAEAIRTRAPDVAIVPMVIPLVSLASAEKLALRLRLPLPERSLARLARGGEAEGWRLFGETLRELRGSGLCDGIALMTQQLDPPAAFGAAVRSALDEAL
jgi:homocysteine S-methyltransferase